MAGSVTSAHLQRLERDEDCSMRLTSAPTKFTRNGQQGANSVQIALLPVTVNESQRPSQGWHFCVS